MIYPPKTFFISIATYCTLHIIRNNERFHIVCSTHVHQCVKISVILFLVFSVEADFISIVKVRVVKCWIKPQVAS